MVETRYARSGDVSIAYQRVGEQGPTLVAIPPLCSNVEVLWEDPNAARFLRGLASFSRFLHFDKRGSGMSDRVGLGETLEARIEDVRAVLDAE
jgi:pimeloyl-ACP methyl ester carboxylesterase